MAFLAPAAAGAVSATAGASALASAAGAATASSALGAGLTAGTALGSGAAMAAMPALSYAGANLAAPGLLGALPSAIAPTAGIFAKAAPALGGLSSLTPAAPGIFAKASPALGGLSSMTPTIATKAASGISPTLASGAYNPAYAEMLGKQFATKLPPPGSPDVARTMLASTEQITPMAFKPPPSAQFLNTVQEGAALPGVTSNLPAQTFGNVAGGPAIPKVTSALPVSTTPTALTPASVSPIEAGQSWYSNLANLIKNPSMDAAGDYVKEHPYATAAGAYGLYSLMRPKPKQPEVDKGMIRPYEYARTQRPEAYATSPVDDTSERLYFNEQFTPREPYAAAEGGLMGLAVGGPVETMSAMNSVGSNLMYPQSQLQTPMYSNPSMQRPEPVNVISPSSGAAVGMYSGEQKFADGGETKTEGEYKYSFDPKTNTFTQLGTPRYATVGNRGSEKAGSPLYTGEKTAGGIAAPVGGSGIAALPVAAAPVSPYQSPEEQLGLAAFYEMMNRRLAAQGGYGGFAGYANGGQINLQGTLNLNAGNESGGNVNGYRAAGSGSGGFDPRAVAADPQGFVRHIQEMKEREASMPGSTMLAKTHDFQPTYQSQPTPVAGMFGQAAGIMRALPFAAGGGVSDLGGYSDGGRLLKGPGDGVSDSIPAVIGNRQPARLADGEFVVPARIVSELGNGSTEAGARKLYAMMDRVQRARRKTVGKDRVAANTKADKYLPA